MLLTKSIAAAIIEKNKAFAPNTAKVMLVHEDARVIFAEKFEMGAKFWYADNLRESKLQGIIHKLTLVAKRNDQGDWVGVSDFSTKITPKAPLSRQERILEAQEKLRAARSTPKAKPDASPVITPATKLPPVSDKSVEQYAEKRNGNGMSVSKMSKAVEPFKTNPAVEVVSAVTEVVSKIREDMFALGALDDPSEFISLRELEAPTRRRVANELFVSFRPNGKIILCKALRESLPWATLNMMVTRDFKRFGIMQGKDYNVNQSGTYVNRAMCDKLTFPEDTATIRVVLNWDDKLNMYVGDFQ
ncbi:hypothetical protein P46FS4_64 [Salmonella phage P46FS4]|uniref:Uncharacterized protein n=1 Tax=Salmonella phage P46FS4 TaxID=2712940 RepID=A0A6G6XTL8_9CAUD|nr:hypothetical protein HYQ39_gp064 [Salmonella phage P46FS4]QIG62130.1 hypothetical protein P46FS4_64 [Salmonella phage P46FS4]